MIVVVLYFNSLAVIIYSISDVTYGFVRKIMCYACRIIYSHRLVVKFFRVTPYVGIEFLFVYPIAPAPQRSIS